MSTPTCQRSGYLLPTLTFHICLWWNTVGREKGKWTVYSSQNANAHSHKNGKKNRRHKRSCFNGKKITGKYRKRLPYIIHFTELHRVKLRGAHVSVAWHDLLAVCSQLLKGRSVSRTISLWLCVFVAAAATEIRDVLCELAHWSTDLLLFLLSQLLL